MILVEVNEESTQRFTVVIYNSLSGTEVVPTAFTWTLSDRHGVVINSRENVSEGLASTVIITLAGDDLQIVDQTEDREYRILTVKTDEGSALRPFTTQAEFWVKNLKVIT